MKKMKRGLFRYILLVAMAFVGAVALNTDSVFAANTPEYQIGITPFVHAFGKMEPGESYTDSFTVQNTGLNDFHFEISFGTYSVQDGSYGPDFSKETQYTDMINWISVDIEEGFLQSGEEQKITYTIAVPEDAHGGAQAAAIFATLIKDDDNDEDMSVGARSQLAYPVYGNVNGKLIETANIVENKIPGFLFNAPIYAESVVENTGNVYSDAAYILQVFPLFSDEEVYTNEERPDEKVVFPETQRYNKISWENSPQLGIFRVRQTVRLFDVASVEEKYVILCPIWFLFICLVVLFIIIFSIVNHLRNRGKEA